MKNRTDSLLSFFFFLTLSVCPLSVYAESIRLEEIIVTAQKREQSIQDVPISITVLTSDDMHAAVLEDFSDLDKVVPNISYNTSGASNNAPVAVIFIRGIGQRDFSNTVEPGIGTYVDGVYFGRTLGSVLDLLDVERVEVLRGPQGTLFGRNTIGGAINVVTSKPDDELYATAKIEYGTDERIDVQGLVSGALGANLWGKFAASHKEQDGYIDNLINGESYGDRNSETYRGALYWEPTENFRLKVAADYREDNQSSVTTTLASTTQISGPLLVNQNIQRLIDPTFNDPSVALVGPHATRATGPNYYEGEFWGVSADATWDMTEILTTRLIFSHREIDSLGFTDGDNQPGPGNLLGEDYDQEQTTVEFQLLGTHERFEWVLGAFYMDEESSFLSDVCFGCRELFDAFEATAPFPTFDIPWLSFQSGLCPALAPPGVGIPLPPCAGGAGNPLNTFASIALNTTRTVDAENYAVFGQGTYALTENLSLTGGLRYSHDKKESVLNQLTVLNNILAVIPTPDSWDFLDYRVGLEYKLNDQTLLYFMTSTGAKSGGINPRPLTNEGFDPFDEESLTAYEIGAKTDLFNDTLRLNSAVFYYDYSDVQVLSNVPTVAGTDIIIQNGGSATLWGFEVEATIIPTDRWVLTASAGYTDFEWDVIDPATGIDIDNAQAMTSDWTLTAATQHTIPNVFGGSVVLRGNFHWQDDMYIDEANSIHLKQNSYETLNLHGTWYSADDRIELSLYGRNITDNIVKVGGTDIMTSFGWASSQFTRGIEWGMSARYTYH